MPLAQCTGRFAANVIRRLRCKCPLLMLRFGGHALTDNFIDFFAERPAKAHSARGIKILRAALGVETQQAKRERRYFNPHCFQTSNGSPRMHGCPQYRQRPPAALLARRSPKGTHRMSVARFSCISNTRCHHSPFFNTVPRTSSCIWDRALMARSHPHAVHWRPGAGPPAPKGT